MLSFGDNTSKHIAAGEMRDRLQRAPLPAPHEAPRLFTDGETGHGGPHGPRHPNLFYAGLRRTGDIVVSLAALTVFLAILPLIALAVFIDSPGPVFYSQIRIGRNRRRRPATTSCCERRKVIYPGRPFRIWKLRSMHTDAETDGPRLATENDARITRVGRLLRLSRLDEVPQFWNVLRGEMTLIGPRPERLCYVRQYEMHIPGYLDRLDVTPGITGLAQVNVGYDEDLLSVRRKLMLDSYYIHRANPWLDLRILAATVRVVLTGAGAR